MPGLEISWFDWELDERAQRQLEFTQRLIALRRAHPVFHRRDFLTGEARDGGLPDAWWFRLDGRRMTQYDWSTGAHCLGLFLNGDGITAPGPGGERVEDDSFLLLFNGSGEDCVFHMPSRRFGARWTLVLETCDPDAEAGSRTVEARGEITARGALAGAAAASRLRWRASAPPTGSSWGRGSVSPAPPSSCPTSPRSASRTCTSSPVWAAREGSTHGYDVVDPARLSDALGGEAGFRALAETARAAGLGLLLDVVPNHMATDAANPYWSDPELRRRFFDIDPETGRHRRFFDIDHLAGVRQEDPEVFEATHRLVLELVARRARRRPADRPSRRARRPGGLPRAAARRRRRARVGREDPRSRRARCATGRSRARSATSSSVDVTALFVDPAGERER